MYTLTSFRRRIAHGGEHVDVALPAGQVRWLDAQEHAGENVGDTATHTIFVELKEPRLGGPAVRNPVLGPSGVQ